MAAKRRSLSPEEPVLAAEALSTSEKRALLHALLEKASDVQMRDSSDAAFKAWKNRVERTLTRVYGSPSTPVQHFRNLDFHYNPVIWSTGVDYSADDRRVFERDLSVLVESIKAYIEELGPDEKISAPQQIVPVPVPLSESPSLPRQVFISHASKDVKIVEDLIDLLEALGLRHDQIFCSSVPSYGVPLGENFLDSIKGQLTGKDALILFVITREFFDSPISLCEMGAGWVLARQHIPIIVPPFEFKDMKGVIPLTQGLILTDALKLNELKETIERAFGLMPMSLSAWERKRNRFLSNVRQKIDTGGT